MPPSLRPQARGDRPAARPAPDDVVTLAQLLTQIDEYLRSDAVPVRSTQRDTGHDGDHLICRPADLLAAFLSTGPNDTGQLAANHLIDIIGFTALHLRHQAGTR